VSEAIEREPEPWFVQPELWFAASVVVNSLDAVIPERAEHDPLRLASLLVGGVLVLTIMRRASLYGSRAVQWAGRAAAVVLLTSLVVALDAWARSSTSELAASWPVLAVVGVVAPIVLLAVWASSRPPGPR
jgi:small-conductance mechanosensitive channel